MNIRLHEGLPFVSVAVTFRQQTSTFDNCLLDTGSTGTIFSADQRSYHATIPLYTNLHSLKFYNADFSKEIPEVVQSFDLLLSFYAGFISEYCTHYLRPQGIFVVNNSHGDAPLAYLNPNYRLVGVVNRKAERFKLAFDNLDTYFVTKSGKPIIREELLKTMRGPVYTKSPYAYVFKKYRNYVAIQVFLKSAPVE